MPAPAGQLGPNATPHPMTQQKVKLESAPAQRASSADCFPSKPLSQEWAGSWCPGQAQEGLFEESPSKLRVLRCPLPTPGLLVPFGTHQSCLIEPWSEGLLFSPFQ